MIPELADFVRHELMLRMAIGPELVVADGTLC
jgi:hypothetical protein